MSSKNIMVLGGAGYIGSHMVRLLLQEKYRPVVFDNLSTGHKSFVPKGVTLVRGDLRRKADIVRALRRYRPDTVMHFAASIVVPESVAQPLKYYENNVLATILLLQAMTENKVRRFIFSSTAAVYGEPKTIPVAEDAPTVPTNPYGASKLMVEQILKDSVKAYDFRYISLRYFNVAGSHPTEPIGIKYKVVTHLIPSILKVASGERAQFQIFGDDHPTPDGSCIRDFIYVMDLCRAHLLALKALQQGHASDVFNLGSQNGYSVKEVLNVAEKVTGLKIPAVVAPRRPGDPAKIVASSAKAQRGLGWKPQASLEEIVQTAWRWEQLQKKGGKR